METRPHRSTTHKELFFHITEYTGPLPFRGGTVFMRQEESGKWMASAALCSLNDPFCRRIGRNVARRRYFRADGFNRTVVAPIMEKPGYEEAMGVFLFAATINGENRYG